MYAISRDHVLPSSSFFRKMAVNTAWLTYFLSVAITCAVIGSTVAFSAVTATATIATNASYLFPIVAIHTSGKKTFMPAKWNLGRFSLPLAVVSSLYISFLFVVLLLLQLYPVTAQTLNYAPILHWYDLDRRRSGLDLSKVGRETLAQGPDQDYHRRRVKIGKGREGRKSECHGVRLTRGRKC
jgi:Amino acid permease